MQRLAWAEEHGQVTWTQTASRWLGSWERQRARAGLYASARGAMVAFVLDGAMEITVCGGGTALRAGDALIIRGAPFRYEMARGTRMVMTEVIRPPSSPVSLPTLARIPACAVPARTARVLANDRDAFAASLVPVAEALDGLYLRAGQPVSATPGHSTRLMWSIKQYLDAHFSDAELRLGHVARRFKIDPFYLARQFARVIGVAPKQYVQHLRVEYFLRTLLRQPRPILELAIEAGFSEYAAFSRLLRRELGRPPSRLLEEPKIKFVDVAGGGHGQAHHR